MSQFGAILLAFAVADTGLFLVNAAIQLARNRDAKAGWFSGLLAFGAFSAALALPLFNTFVQTESVIPSSWHFLVAASAVVAGIVFFLVERRRPGFDPQNSYGLLALGIGTLTLAAGLFIPILPEQFSPPFPDLTVAPTMTAPMLLPAAPTATPTSSPTPSPSNTPRPTVISAPTPTPTRERYIVRTATPTPAIRAACNALVEYNLNLRARPDAQSDILDVIPNSTIVQVDGQNTDGTWWHVEYNDKWGWVSGQYVALDDDCSTVPLITP